MASDEKSWNIHLRYIIFMLAAVIVVLVTVKWSQIPQLVEYITFALTLTSLVLAVLAIVYAFFSNSTLTEALGSLMHVSGQVSDSARDLSEATERLESDLQMIPSGFAKMEEKVEAIPEMLAVQLTDSGSSQGIAKTIDPLFSEEAAARFLRRTSPSGLLHIHSHYLAEKSKGAFRVSEASEAIPAMNTQYFLGFSVALASMSLLDYRDTKGIISSTKINEELGKGARDEYALRIEVEEREDYKEKMRMNLEMVESYFQT